MFSPGYQYEWCFRGIFLVYIEVHWSIEGNFRVTGQVEEVIVGWGYVCMLHTYMHVHW